MDDKKIKIPFVDNSIKWEHKTAEVEGTFRAIIFLVVGPPLAYSYIFDWLGITKNLLLWVTIASIITFVGLFYFYNHKKN